MATTALTPDTFYAQVESSGITLIDFWADWCGPCLNFAPIYEDVAKRFPAHAFAKVDTEEYQDLASKLGIAVIPALMIYREGILLFNEAGALPASELEKLVKLIERVDMNEVRAEMSEAVQS
jgi:thioredoxin 1